MMEHDLGRMTPRATVRSDVFRDGLENAPLVNAPAILVGRMPGQQANQFAVLFRGNHFERPRDDRLPLFGEREDPCSPLLHQRLERVKLLQLSFENLLLSGVHGADKRGQRGDCPGDDRPALIAVVKQRVGGKIRDERGADIERRVGEFDVGRDLVEIPVFKSPLRGLSSRGARTFKLPHVADVAFFSIKIRRQLPQRIEFLGDLRIGLGKLPQSGGCGTYSFFVPARLLQDGRSVDFHE